MLTLLLKGSELVCSYLLHYCGGDCTYDVSLMLGHWLLLNLNIVCTLYLKLVQICYHTHMNVCMQHSPVCNNFNSTVNHQQHHLLP